jgi:hypothetical protein
MTIRPPRRRRLLVPALLLTALQGCAEVRVLEPPQGRHFEFRHDSFAYSNGLSWEYIIDPASGQMTTRRNEPAPDFTHRCFAVSRMARQFFQYARFDPAARKLDDAGYRRLIEQVVSLEPDEARRAGKVLIPGYADLRSFSADKAPLLKEATGGYLYSLFTFSNWRMVFPFSRGHQEDTARRLLAEVQLQRLPIVHLIHFAPFPITEIDHVVLLFAAQETPDEIRFEVYDPNYHERPGSLVYERKSRTFVFPATKYYDDGPLDVYEIFGSELS